MPREEKTTVRRVLKRNTLNILSVVLILLLIGAIVFSVIIILDLFKPNGQEPEQPPETVDQQPAEAPTPSQPAPEPEPELPKEPGWQADGEFVPPFEGRTQFLADRRLALTYDDQKLTLCVDGSRYTLQNPDGDATPRMDLEQLPAALEDLDDAALDRLAIGILQAYYYVAPRTEEITVSEVTRTKDRCCAALSAPAYENAPAMEARVCFIQAGDQLWYAAVLLPEGADTASFEQAFDNLMVK